MKIEEVERKVKNMHLQSKVTDKDLSLFWSLHLKPVIEFSKQLAKKYNANFDIVWLSAILHDIARLEGLEPHDEVGAEKAYSMLLDDGFSEQTAQGVRDVILTHRCKKHQPKTMEQKILATADAMSHFNTPFYFWFFKVNPKPLKERLEDGLSKIERDYSEKIFFEDERESVKKEYDLLKEWFSYFKE